MLRRQPWLSPPMCAAAPVPEQVLLCATRAARAPSPYPASHEWQPARARGRRAATRAAFISRREWLCAPLAQAVSRGCCGVT
eukprot:6740364-Prymnesium_polylepis.1